ncbi:NnrU family protein [Rhodovulum sulfidophilum]|uniref:NnrU family protein n=1 Tax=Rhodovulum sulfidophilum TaxID=35806 RepID=A0A0D6AYA9_RHOSU|nr:NnrU family protein [Rhodovulum sulfidophilum]MBL3551099.1 hypothetical protein [Rhodovulum sulfidophilum]MBL3573619.1 hypothetical protein [Rhodovulum sulfidophilum]MBL3608962.1 hypothetical protein [Rhodovulum sulfidophilum]MCE8430142.1 NnrU family protein [Rhodovulum sulfidophilum]MCE8439200.1 NnrU family protein [Rhodovulum sulfidophilum]
MFLLILGVALWSFAHLFKRLFPGIRAMLDDKLGMASKALFAVPLVVSVVLMVIGYKTAGMPYRFAGPSWLVHVNNTLMLGAVALFGVGSSKSHARQWFRHPMLYGFITWAVAHLLVNWDLASIILFGGLGAWAVAEIVLINRSEKGVTRYTGGTLKGDLRLGGIAIALYVGIILVHFWAGVPPLPMTS